MRNSKLRIELDCTFETFDRLAQTFRCSSRRVVTSGSVELARFFVLAGLCLGRRHQDLPRNRGDGFAFSTALPRCGRRLLLRPAIQRRMTQVAENPLEERIATQWIKLRLDA